MSSIQSRKHVHPRVHATVHATVTVAMAGAMLLPSITHAQETEQVAPAPSTANQLPAVHVSATEESYKVDHASSPKYTQPMVDTPQTITIIARPLMDQQGATTLTEALRNTPGVGTFFLGENGSTSTGDAIYMRGFDSSSAIFVDNVRDLGSVSRDMFNISQVEVLKGPAGTDNGRGSPTGSINLVTKQPEMTDSFASSATYGSWNQKRVTADWNKVIDEATGTAMRLNLMKQESGVPGRHMVENNRSGIAPSFVFGLNGPTRVFVDLLHVDQNNVPDGGAPTIGLPGYSSPDASRSYIGNAPRVSSSNFYGLASDFDKSETNMVTVRVEHDFSPDLKFQNTTRYEKTSQNYQLTSFIGSSANLLTPVSSDTSTWSIARNLPTRKNQSNQIMTNQSNITAELQTGSIKHTLVAGVELTEERQQALSFTRNGSLPAANLYNPNPYDAVAASFSMPATGYNNGKTDTISAYLFDTLKFNDKWSLTGGARVDNYRTSYYANAAGVITDLSTSGNLVNWKLGASYKPTEDSSVYALYATSQQPPGGANFALSAAANSASNSNYAPQKTTTTEIGTKWDVLNKALALTAALYRTEVRNDVEQDPTTLLYYQTGKKQVQGIELGVTGNITVNWAVTAGYTIMDTRIVSGAAATASGEKLLAYTPRQAFTSWTTYKLPQGFTIGGGARYVSSLLRGTDGAIGTPQYANAYWVFDSMLSYVVNKNVDLQLNLTNMFNKDYVAAINKSGYRDTPGAARAIALTANFKY
ncbi:catecholate siderophore receptor [Herbaspirillum sp. Sphag1AN]|uniref:catecholate siderophore receptor Fiu n=1 Tax=unclassified Herbaspirillum TaxID=2624150 RepID=UPI0016137538|nr:MULTISPECIES: catecholate siderophore receptor Fiu [unclassified Herbaspirillum]MBB3213539.1 catecholate siderophore receptor [Herbaspirillum sp. Sphag1AN]MBB3246737.1 catecholate siderophore receptor [Herbaspirillum sp. Sphag64]